MSEDMTMIERVARHIFSANTGTAYYEAYHPAFEHDQPHWETLARAAIEAMREPNDEMLDKMNDVWVDAGEFGINVCFADLKEIHAAAIDAALNEIEEGE